MKRENRATIIYEKQSNLKKKTFLKVLLLFLSISFSDNHLCVYIHVICLSYIEISKMMFLEILEIIFVT